ncbi:dihydrodipicolinate synthase family protein [Natrarchaeobius sp. A-rgal3]|uniref:dihydrodipicolinate synthase family protein n=1 Tax=Natrarchaeobius versutus TaxID=1679078 RepID=UPI00350EEA99
MSHSDDDRPDAPSERSSTRRRTSYRAADQEPATERPTRRRTDRTPTDRKSGRTTNGRDPCGEQRGYTYNGRLRTGWYVMDTGSLRAQFRDVAFTTAVPFEEGSLAVRHDALAQNLSAQFDAGARLFVACGNTGEYDSLTDEERIAVVETHVDAVGDDATIVGGVGGSLRHARRLASAYENVGADAVMVMHPGHTYLHEAGLETYYHRICDATDLGVVIYKRGPEVTRGVLDELSEREEVVAVKYAVDDVEAFSRALEGSPGEVAWINGIAERYALSFGIEGADGYTTGIGNFVPRATLSLFEAIRDGHWERAREIQRSLRPLETLRAESGEGNALPAANNVPVVKYGMDRAGYVGGPVRPPLVDLSEADRERTRRLLEGIDATPTETVRR